MGKKKRIIYGIPGALVKIEYGAYKIIRRLFPNNKFLRLIISSRDRIIDLMEGINSAGHVKHDKLGFGYEPGSPYYPILRGDLNLMLGSDVSNQDIFIDIGSGKGRMVYLAARHYPFCKVIGVEISSELNNIARSNLQKKLHKLRCKNIELVCSNVSEYKVPDNVTVIYMFNPFQGAVFEDLVDRLNISLSRSPRRIRVIYRNPVMQKCLVDKGFQVVFKQDELVMFEK